MANPLGSAFYESLDRCLLAPGFLRRFYELFLASSPEVRAKFVNTDFATQSHLLGISLQMMLAAGYGSPGSTAELTRLGHIHGRKGRDIPPHLYRLWLDSLVAAAAEFDQPFSPELEMAWRQMLEPGIQTMIAAYEVSHAGPG